MKRAQVNPCLAQQQKGVAILVITIILLLVATIGTLMIGRVGLVEQKVVGTDVRSKEVYSAAVGGLEYATDWFKGSVWTDLVWTDSDGDGLAEVGDTLTTGLSNTSLNADSYAHTLTYTLLTDWNDDVDGTPVVVRIDSLAVAVADSHITKTISKEVVRGKIHTFAGTMDPPGDADFTGPPILIEGCTDDSNTITGQPDIIYNHPVDIGVNPNGVAVGSTSGVTDLNDDGVIDQSELNACIAIEDIEGHLNLCSTGGDCDDADDFVEDGGEFRDYLPNPMTLWQSVFGDISEADLRELERISPTQVLFVDSTYPHYGDQPSWNGNTWHTNLPVGFSGPPDADDNPVILYFDTSVGCPPINGNTEIYGLVYYETVDCGNQGWGGGVLYGTLAKSGDLSSLNANAVIINTSLDFGNGGGGGGVTPGDDVPIDGIPKLSDVPGSWRDY